MENQNVDTQSVEAVSSRSLTFYELFLTIKKFWLTFAAIIVLFVVLGSIAAAVVSKPSYVATAKVMVQYGSQGNTVADDRNALLFGRDLMGTIKDFTTSDVVAADVEANAGENVIKNYKGGISLSAAEDSTIVYISFTTKKSPEAAVATVNQIAKSLINVANSTETTEDGKIKPRFKLLYDNIAPVDEARGAATKNNWMLYVAVGLLIGIIAAFCYVILRFFLDDTIRSKTELEQITGFRSIAFISDIASTKNNTKKY